MKVFITNIYHMDPNGAQSIAQNHITKTALSMGFHEMPIFHYTVETDSPEMLRTRIDGILAGVQEGDVVIIQTPTWNQMTFEYTLVQRLRRYRDVKIALWVHDFTPMEFDGQLSHVPEAIEYYNQADLLILPSARMRDKLIGWGLKTPKILIQEIFDFVIDFKLRKPTFQRKLYFTGNPVRFPFVQDWHCTIPLELYSTTKPNPDANVHYQGVLNNDELLFEMSGGGFGLVWPQQSEYDYYAYNLPLKCSSFLAAGIPVLVKKNLRCAEIIERYGLGRTIESPEEASDIVQSMTEQEYEETVQRIIKFNRMLRSGWFTRKILTDTVYELLT